MLSPSPPTPSNSRKTLLVLGAGPAGHAAAFRAADLGWEVTLVDRRPALGGTCLHAGCIPSKALLHAAELAQTFRGDRASALGIVPASSVAPRIDLPALRAWKSSVVAKLADGLSFLARRRHIRCVTGEARIVPSPAPGTGAPLALEVDGAPHTADALLLAPGSVPAIPRGWPAPSTRIWTSDQALALPEIPTSLAVIGAGAIGLELGLAYAGLGARVTLLEALPSLLPTADRDLLVPLLRALRATFAAVRTSVKLRDIRETSDAVLLDIEAHDGSVSTETCSHVLLATGRRPALPPLPPEALAAGLHLDGRGRLPAGPLPLPGIYAAGDLTPGPMLAHKATREATDLVDALTAGRLPSPPASADVPSVVYTRPAVAWTGLTETDAKAARRPVRVTKSALAANGRALADDTPAGHLKLILDPGDATILGAAAVGSGADWAIGELANAIALHLRAPDLARGIRPHPALTESILSAALQ